VNQAVVKYIYTPHHPQVQDISSHNNFEISLPQQPVLIKTTLHCTWLRQTILCTHSSLFYTNPNRKPARLSSLKAQQSIKPLYLTINPFIKYQHQQQ
jgi:hypothetical protein